MAGYDDNLAVLSLHRNRHPANLIPYSLVSDFAERFARSTVVGVVFSGL